MLGLCLHFIRFSHFSLHSIHQLLFVMEIVLTVTAGTEFLNRVLLQRTSGFNLSQLSGSKLHSFSTANTEVQPAGLRYESDSPRSFFLPKLRIHSPSPRSSPNAQPIHQTNPTVRTLPHDPITHKTHTHDVSNKKG